jgi:acetyl-CoA acetyltransferase family protein
MPDICIPYGAYWASPFAKWQGSLAHLHSLRFAAHVTKHALAKRNISPDVFDFGVLGTTVPQKGAFYGLPWLMGEAGAEQVGGPTINQACATGVRIMEVATSEILAGRATVALAVAADRTSNGPHIYYPAPNGTGGTGEHENWVLDNFTRDPYAKLAMVETAENVARKHNVGTAEQNAVTMRRYEQYADATANDAKFLRRFMDLPFDVPDARFAMAVGQLNGDEGIHPTTADKLAALKPVMPGGTVTYGTQTHPADGTAAMIVTTAERARELSRDSNIDIRILSYGQARVDRGYMPEAPVPAARAALDGAGIAAADLAAIKSHNPFVINDIVFARHFNLDVMSMNNYGCSLVWGHPQGPTGVRGVIELIEELVMRGGGLGLFQGCAAGDTGMAVVLSVTDQRR